MKSILKPILIIIALAIAGFASMLLLPLYIGGTILVICYWGIRITILLYLVWFFLPYIKKGINYLVKHREN